MLLSDPLTSLKGIGEKTAQGFHALGLFCINDLLHYFPRDYDSISEITPMAAIRTDGRYTLHGKVTGGASVFRKNGRSLLQFGFSDGTAQAKVTVFGMPYLKKSVFPGREMILNVTVKRKGMQLFLSQPRILTQEEYESSLHQLQAVYPLSGSVTNAAVRKAVRSALPLAEDITEYLPEAVREERKLLSIAEAIRMIHAPKDREEVFLARRRLAFDEFFLFLARMELLKAGGEKEQSLHRIESGMKAAELMRAALPYRLTGAQERAIEDIRKDMESGFCMNRLVQGDVGSGKTVVAFTAALSVILEGKQAALMAPTEVLARQHHEDACALARDKGLPFHPQLLVGSMTAKEKREAKKRIASGEADLVIGTHALIQEDVEAKELALIITDEQHRFGVRQRMNLAEKGKAPHVLVMSATPIPRTLGLILYGDLDVSLIDELPGDRLPIKNAVVDESWRKKTYQFMLSQIAEGRQVYIICPMVEEGAMEDLSNVTDYAESLRELLPPHVRIDMLHGRMKAAEKSEVMGRFSAGETDILVSTTVVEVGVNVPNATVMLVENAERFGLSQLHQLRGRVGRGKHQSYCLFMAGGEDETLSKKTRERLNILAETNDGFRIAEEDLKQRGPGDFFGLRQSGLPYFRVADLYGDSDMLAAAGQTLKGMLRDTPEHLAALRDALRQREDISYTEFHSICL
ncbi:MAG: ATP-dependent DNA helicase RecG [Lachnospiraceae bacterium]|nr:ATP-dependent DNA helicase RecG [Lachnospiraceae bacterium]